MSTKINISDEQIVQIRHLWADNYKIGEIAAEIGYSYGTIQRWIKELELPMHMGRSNRNERRKKARSRVKPNIYRVNWGD